ncbi:hypothetical protein EV424DRAFT_698843 [Suillus variegatus]|nr:hypothetical protein EV424DRAFT_698843 [Suillus variegatus]
MRQFHPEPFAESHFVFSAAGTDSAEATSAEASSPAAEGGCSTPPTEYTPELETSELPHFAIDPMLLDDKHDTTSKKRKLDSLSSEPEDHDADMSTLTGTLEHLERPPTRRFQSPFIPAPKKICSSNQMTSKIPIPSRMKVTTETVPPSSIHSTASSTIRSSVPPSIRSSVPPSIRSSVPPSIRSSVPPSIHSTAPSSSRSTAPSSTHSTAPPRSNVPPLSERPSTAVSWSTRPSRYQPPSSKNNAVICKKPVMPSEQQPVSGPSMSPRSFLVNKPRPHPKPISSAR